jgi:hypothetical protein
MPRVIKLLRSGELSDPSIWEGGVTPGPEDVATIDGHCLTIDVPWKLRELRVHTHDRQWWEYVRAAKEGIPVDLGRLTVIGAGGTDGD